mmetsp:Transcript_20293/g.47419  ORF Transcript_20293/g.47419 Transcript_20293/m.47419 type:complete len:290 (+) Transcript_20293:659-1528(+)
MVASTGRNSSPMNTNGIAASATSFHAVRSFCKTVKVWLLTTAAPLLTATSRTRRSTMLLDMAEGVSLSGAGMTRPSLTRFDSSLWSAVAGLSVFDGSNLCCGTTTSTVCPRSRSHLTARVMPLQEYVRPCPWRNATDEPSSTTGLRAPAQPGGMAEGRAGGCASSHSRTCAIKDSSTVSSSILPFRGLLSASSGASSFGHTAAIAMVASPPLKPRCTMASTTGSSTHMRIACFTFTGEDDGVRLLVDSLLLSVKNAAGAAERVSTFRRSISSSRSVSVNANLHSTSSCW